MILLRQMRNYHTGISLAALATDAPRGALASRLIHSGINVIEGAEAYYGQHAMRSNTSQRQTNARYQRILEEWTRRDPSKRGQARKHPDSTVRKRSCSQCSPQRTANDFGYPKRRVD